MQRRILVAVALTFGLVLGGLATAYAQGLVFLPFVARGAVSQPHFDPSEGWCLYAPAPVLERSWQVSAPPQALLPGQSAEIGLRSKFGQSEETYVVVARVIAPDGSEASAVTAVVADEWAMLVYPYDFSAPPISYGVYTVIWELVSQGFIACHGFQTVAMPTSTATATATATVTPTPTATPIPVLSLGQVITFAGLSHSVTRYEEADTCPNGYDKPDEGAKLVVLWVRSENTSSDYMEVPSLDIKLLQNGIEIGRDAGGIPCRYDDRAWGNACWQWGGDIWPGVSCEGWEAFQVPTATEVQGLVAETRFHYWLGQSALAQWRLAP